MNAEFGVFLPVASGGWIVSQNTPRLDGLWPQNREAAVIADEEGLDFVMSMGKWRGFGGATDHWGRSLESVTMMSAIAAVTSKVKPKTRMSRSVLTLIGKPTAGRKVDNEPESR